MQAKKDTEKIKKLIQQVKELQIENEGLMKEASLLRRRQGGGQSDEGSDRADSPDSDSYRQEERARRSKDAETIAHLVSVASN
ncbi:hypothetical protein BCR33DRAFT_233661 [Rhizoclosmatium globosum]|uniref:Uncharacterized protein n=1 Tax=Rhizoclosmatium globosum TaxID=329046 RepID=A0A1Y2CAH8_9FUNG|nr:hypothetical protein BCR33DRAFT_233661 [Rhizoclosmatium globosum]|eukprot:ORY44038.1 hypothetical protein BCR33DRAFT_233661 [Rhizoclosmatium globosum]